MKNKILSENSVSVFKVGVNSHLSSSIVLIDSTFTNCYEIHCIFQR